MANELNAAYVENPRVFLQGKALAVNTPLGLEYTDLAEAAATSPVDDALLAWQPEERKADADDDAADLEDEKAAAEHSAKVFVTATGPKEWRKNVLMTKHRTFYADINPQAASPQNYAVTFQLEPGDGLIPCYFLPWRQNQITHLQVGDDPGPAFFFTATLDGCSVYVVGTESNPTVYHANAKGAPDTAKQGDYMGRLVTLAFFRGMIPRPVELQKKHVAPVLSKPMYHRTAAPYGIGSESDEPSAPSFNTGANVFGFRQEGKWSFYYQQFVIGNCHPDEPLIQPLLQAGRVYYRHVLRPTRIFVGFMLKAFEPLWPKGIAHVEG